MPRLTPLGTAPGDATGRNHGYSKHTATAVNSEGGIF